MRTLILIVLVVCCFGGFLHSLHDGQAAEEQFRETKCERSDLDPEFYLIRLEAPDRTKKRLTFNNRENGLLTFKSTSLEYLKWAAGLSEFDALSYQATQRDFGMLSANHKNRELAYEFGIVSRECWDGLRQHVDGLISTREISKAG